jgi:hypothetical protein
MVVMQELSDHDVANYSTVAEHLIKILFKDVIILMTAEAYFWMCQQTEFSRFITGLLPALSPFASACMCRLIGSRK